MIELGKIRIDGGTQSRLELNQNVVAEYAAHYVEGVQMPPVTVFFDGEMFWLADGFHRYYAAKQAGRASINEERFPGTQRLAVLYSLSANGKHGLRRSNADKRRAVERLLADPEWALWPQAKIASVCAVSREYVNRIVSDFHLVIDHKIDAVDAVIVSRNGTTYTQNVAKIGMASNTATRPLAVSETKSINISSETDKKPIGQSEIEELKDFCFEQGQNLKLMLDENESMGRVIDADDKAAAALAEAKRFREMNLVLTERNNGLINELNEVKRRLRSAQHRAERAEAKLAQGGV